jgi:poly(3-hydroxybutyrate) depolymerase
MMGLALALLWGLSAAMPQKDFPCKGCVFEPHGDALLVVLHGDGQSAEVMRGPWSKVAADHAVSLLLVQCPKDLGCNGSFWQWNGDPKWLDGLVDAVAKQQAIDAKRVWIAGWSGGGTYLGMNAFKLSRFAAMSIDGGGMTTGGACPKHTPPTYFLVGDKNPLHNLAIDLRDALTKCGGEIVWDLRKGANHPAEWDALNKSADRILTWFEAHPKP